MKLVAVIFALYGLSQGVPKIKPLTCSTCEFFSHNATYQRCVQNGTIHLTFDDGPVPDLTNPLMDLLKTNNISATFFINGANYWPDLDQPESRATLRRAIQEGHRVAHHTWSHLSLLLQTKESIFYEMETLTDKIEEILDFRPSLMRPPFGLFNTTVVDIVHGELGYDMILWSICPCDWAGSIEDSLTVYKNVLEGTDPSKTPGFIALHHDTLQLQLELTRRTIEYVKTTGYRFVSMQECLGL